MGYIKKDIYISNKIIKQVVWLYIFVLILGLTVRYSYDYGNLKANIGGSSICEIVFVALTGIMVASELCRIPLSCIDKDIESGFMKVAYSSPYTQREIAKSKVLELIMFAVISIASLGVYGFIFGVLFGFANVKYGVWIGIMTILFTVFVLGLAMPLTVKYKNSNVAIMIVLSIFGTSILLLIIYCMMHAKEILIKITSFFDGTKKISIGGIVGKYGPKVSIILIFLCLLGIIIAYFCSLKAFERRDKVCGA